MYSHVLITHLNLLIHIYFSKFHIILMIKIIEFLAFKFHPSILMIDLYHLRSFMIFSENSIALIIIFKLFFKVSHFQQSITNKVFQHQKIAYLTLLLIYNYQFVLEFTMTLLAAYLKFVIEL